MVDLPPLEKTLLDYIGNMARNKIRHSFVQGISVSPNLEAFSRLMITIDFLWFRYIPKFQCNIPPHLTFQFKLIGSEHWTSILLVCMQLIMVYTKFRETTRLLLLFIIGEFKLLPSANLISPVSNCIPSSHPSTVSIHRIQLPKILSSLINHKPINFSKSTQFITLQKFPSNSMFNYKGCRSRFQYLPATSNIWNSQIDKSLPTFSILTSRLCNPLQRTFSSLLYIFQAHGYNNLKLFAHP